jgi:hypothetical protein
LLLSSYIHLASSISLLKATGSSAVAGPLSKFAADCFIGKVYPPYQVLRMTNPPKQLFLYVKGEKPLSNGFKVQLVNTTMKINQSLLVSRQH